MKNILTILTISAFLISCGDKNKQSVDSVIDSGNLEAMKAKKEQVLASYDSIGDVLSKLDVAIAKKTP